MGNLEERIRSLEELVNRLNQKVFPEVAGSKVPGWIKQREQILIDERNERERVTHQIDPARDSEGEMPTDGA